MAFLRRAFKTGHEARPRLVMEIPAFPVKLPESPRTGFVEDKAFEKIAKAIEEPGLQAMVRCAYRLGFRLSGIEEPSGDASRKWVD